jgi:polyhydroxyalkanoate synthesis regulator phasin
MPGEVNPWLETDEKKKWKSFRAALKTIWSKEKVDELTKRLDGYRQELGTRFLVLLNAKSDVLFSDFGEKSQTIVEAVTLSRKTLITSLKEDLTELEERVLLSQREEIDHQGY